MNLLKLFNNKKKIYECCACGILQYASLYEIEDYYGWHIIKGHTLYGIRFKKYDRWICHHCAEHGYITTQQKEEHPEWHFTYDEWMEYVEENNKKLLNQLKQEGINNGLY